MSRFSICNQVTYYESSPGIGISFQELKAEIVVELIIWLQLQLNNAW